MFKAIKDSKIIAINEIGNFPCLVFDNVVEDTEHSIGDYEQYNGEFLLKSDIPALSYSELRQAEYPSLQDQLDMIYWDKVNGTNTWQETITSIKAKYPK